MPITLGTNIAALQAQRRLSNQSSALLAVFQRLSSGQRINRASDDAAGLAVSDSLAADRRVYSQGIRNVNDGISALNIAEGATSELTNIVTRIEELAEQAANGIYSGHQRLALDSEAQSLRAEYLRIIQSTKFNDIGLLDGSLVQLSIQAGFGAAGSVTSGFGGVMGDGTFAGVSSYSVPGIPTGTVAMADLNSDGKLDLAAVADSGGAGYAYVRYGNGDGSFGTAVSYASGDQYARTVAFGDFNGDGTLDLATAAGNPAGGSISLRLGRGDGTFGGAVSFQSGTIGIGEIVVADLNNDGKSDIIGGGSGPGGGYSAIFIGSGGGSFAPMLSISQFSTNLTGNKVADLNRDGILDLVAAGTSGTGYASVRLGNGNGSFRAATTYPAEGLGSANVNLGDLNGDGIIDFVTSGTTGGIGYISVRNGIGDGSFGALVSYQLDMIYARSLTLGDLNGDGRLDIITGSDNLSNGAVGVRLNNGNGSFGPSLSYAFSGQLPVSLDLGDLNGDGVIDLVVGSNSGGNGWYSSLLGRTRSGTAPLLPFSLKTASDAKWALNLMKQKLGQLNLQQGTIGAYSSRLPSVISMLQTTVESYTSAESRIRDSDVAEDSASLARAQIIQQAAAAVLAQARSQPEIALRLLGR